jgi:ribosomal 50S subunit-recycling heat shock protein
MRSEVILRIDYYLKKTLIVKQRSNAKKACELGYITIDGRVAKPSSQVSEGQIVRLRFPGRLLEIKVAGIPAGNVSRAQRTEYFDVIRDEVIEEDRYG